MNSGTRVPSEMCVGVRERSPIYSSLSSVVRAFIDARIDYHSIAEGDNAPETIELPGNHQEVPAGKPAGGSRAASR